MGSEKGWIDKLRASKKAASKDKQSEYSIKFKCSLEKLSSSYPESAKTELTYDNLFRDITPALISYETMSWGEVRKMRAKKGYKNHDVDTTKKNSKSLLDSLNKKIEENYIKQENLKFIKRSLFSLRIDGKKRLFGYVRDNIFYVLWYDAHHEILKVDKNHT